MSTVASPSFVLTRRRLKNVLEKLDTTNSSSDAAVDKKQVEYLLSMKMRKQEKSVKQSSSPDTDETTDEHGIIEKLKSYVWIQCENPECLKWRRLPKSEVVAIDEDAPWFCFMNADLGRNSCEDMEDDYRMFERQARKCHLRCVASTLPIGSLVWAKMAGYCRWPGIISQDPKCGDFVEHDEDPIIPEPTYYHVEFLGSIHSHSWVLAQSVELYGLVAPGNTMKHKLPLTKSKKARVSYQGSRVEAAISEANQLLDCLGHKRLERCVFRSIEGVTSEASLCDVDTKTVTDNVRKDIRSCQRNGIIRINNTTQKRRHHKATAKEMTKSCQHSSSDRKKKDTENGGMQTQMSGREMTCHASLVGSNKEKKYVLDVEMYRHNQAAFQHDVCRFMIRNCRPIRRLPMWHDTPVSLFQLFLAVHQRGGYLQVCDQRDWTAVYIEVTADHRSSSRGMLAKQYYKRNLLPYELYISGHDYQEALTQSKPKNSLLGNSRGSFSQDPADHTDQDPGSDSQSTDSDSTEEDAELDEVKGILGQMDNITAQCDFSYLDDTEHTEPHHSSLVTFYDESRDGRLDDYRLADTASEFGVADTPGEDATQEVPDLCSLVSSDGGEDGEDISVGLNVEEMLQDVAVMQREIDQLEENMSEPW